MTNKLAVTNRIKVIDNIKEAHDQFGYGHGYDFSVVREEDLQALRNGKCWASEIACGEYVHFIALDVEEKEP